MSEVETGWDRLRPAARATLVTALLVVLSAALAPAVAEATGPQEGLQLSWWLLAIMFALVELVVLHAQVRHQAQSLSLCELPLVLGLFFAAPDDLVLARVLGPFFVLLLHCRQSPVKLLFNTALLTANAIVAVAVFHALQSDFEHVLDTWVAVYAAVLASGTLDAVATTLVIGAFEGRLAWRQLVREPLAEAPRALGVASVALVAAYALTLTPLAAVPLAVSGGLILVAFRAYASLHDRHVALERVYRFTQVVSNDGEVDEVLRSVLVEARELLHADGAFVLVTPAGLAGSGLRLSLSADGGLQQRQVDELDDPGGLWKTMIEQDGPMLLPRRSRDAVKRALLEELGCKDALAVPLRISSEVVGMVVVTDRMGEVKTFEQPDVRLLETVTNHAGVALQNGRLIARLRHDALHDALTGLPNRVYLQQEITLAGADLGTSAGMAVLLMDLDRFKEVNDTLGHHSGDALLREVARRLIAGSSGAVVARLGGDEFAAVVPCADTPEAGMQAGRRLLRAIEQPVDLDGTTVTVGGSVGVAWTADADDVCDLLRHADLAMYAAKATGEEVTLYEPAMDTASPERLALVGELRAAIELGQLEVHVQPKARLDTGQVTAVEALVRWHHPVRGMVRPDEFIAVAERSGLIRPLTMYVLRRAVAACASWRRQGVEVNVAVNLSARTLLDMELAHDVREILAEHGVPPRLLTLEITEGSVMVDPERTLRLLVALRDMGVRLSVDDFGTGYSSLSYLKRLPVHEVKIDKSFVTDMTRNPEDASIVRSIVDLGTNLSLDVVAEGVEDSATWTFLAAIGCAYVQGYYLSRPLPLQEFLPWMQDYQLRRGPDALLPVVGVASA